MFGRFSSAAELAGAKTASASAAPARRESEEVGMAHVPWRRVWGRFRLLYTPVARNGERGVSTPRSPVSILRGQELIRRQDEQASGGQRRRQQRQPRQPRPARRQALHVDDLAGGCLTLKQTDHHLVKVERLGQCPVKEFHRRE